LTTDDSIPSRQLSNVSQTIFALTDLFCELYDEVDGDAFRLQADEWLSDEDLEQLSVYVEHSALDGVQRLASLHALCTDGSEQDARRFAVLRGLDRAFAHANPLTAPAGGIPPSLTGLAMRIAAGSRLDSGVRDGALIPRVIAPPVGGLLPSDMRDAFGAVLRVPEHSWKECLLRTLPEHVLLHPHDLRDGLRIACAPIVADPDELLFESRSHPRGGFYRIRPRDLKVTAERIERVLDAMIAAEIRIGVAPELTLSDHLLEVWRDALRARRGRTGKLHWLMVGSGDVGTPRPSNVAVLLDARSGQPLVEQPKVHPFNLDARTLRRWKLDGLLGEQRLDEDLLPGRRIFVLEGGGVRLAILVCEDLKRVEDLASHLRNFGVSHILAPVFGRPIKLHRWEQNRGAVYTESGGSTVIVSNSRVMHNILDTDGATGLVVMPDDAQLLNAESADRIACFTLRRDGTVIVE
jgi:hypothetical protein